MLINTLSAKSIGFKWQIFNDQKNRLGASATYFLLGGTAEAGYRYRTSDKWALDLNYNYFDVDNLIFKISVINSDSRTYFEGTGGGVDLFYSFNSQWNLQLGASTANIENVGTHIAGKLSLSHLWD